MNKLYQRINWQNYPSDSTPLNESNLNKMDAAVDGIDDRVVTLDVTKLPVSTANTMVKDVTFNETTGVFTITKLNGTKVTVNTALEKIATNFRFDHSTQKLILTLIDGTTQEVDLSALLTQYEFLNSSTIQFTIDSSGKVKASVVNGSITGDMLEPNYLANVTLQASKADTSAKNAKESEEKAAEYAENAKNSADSAEPVASTATGTNPTIQDSTNAQLIYGKFKGYTLQDGEPTPDNPVEINGLAKGGAIEVKTCGKNLFKNTATTQTNEGVTFTINNDGSVTANGTATDLANLWLEDDSLNNRLEVGKTYIATGFSNVGVVADGKTTYGNEFVFTEKTERIVPYIHLESGATVSNKVFYPMIRLASIEDDAYQPYQGETTAAIPTNAPLYEGDYLEVYADGSGRLVRAMVEVVLDGSDDEEWFYISPNLYVALSLSPVPKGNSVNLYSNYYLRQEKFDISNTMENALQTNESGALIIGERRFTTMADWKSWLQSNPVTVVYELAEPTETPLTAEQVEQFKKLYTFEPITNVLCDGEVEMIYLKNTNGGKALASVRRGAESVASTATGTNPTIRDSTNAPLIYSKFKGYTLQNGEPTPDNPVEINGLAKDGAIEVGTTGILGEETTANIPIDAPLYEEDYIEVYADGSGRLVRAMVEVVLDGSDDEEWFYISPNLYVALSLSPVPKGNSVNLYSNYYLRQEKFDISNTMENALQTNESGALIIGERRFTTMADWKSWLQSNPVTVVYELAEPTETPLTAEQVEQFKKLYTFEPITNVLCDGEVEMRYYKANVNGETVGMLQEQTKDFAKKAIYGDTTINVGRKEGSFVGYRSTAEGKNTTASGDYAHAEGMGTTASGNYAHAEGMGTTASGDYAHAEGKNTTASGLDSHSEGYGTRASGDYAHAEGMGTTASGDYAHAEGMGTTASGLYSHVEGNGTIAHGNSQHVQGKYNVEDTEDKYAHIVGGGTYKERKNIHTLDWDGNAEFAGNVLGHVNGNSVSLLNITRYLGRIDLGMYATQNTYDFTSFAGYDRYTLVFKGQDANRSLFTRELLTIHNIEKNTSSVGKVCLNISNNYTFEPWVEMYPSGNKTYVVVGITDTTGLTTLVSSLFVEVYGSMD